MIETRDSNLSKGIRQPNGVSAEASKRRHQRNGHLFQGCYQAILVDVDTYLRELIRHVVLNPVRAKLVDQPEKWPWSSYNVMVGETLATPWLVLAQLLPLEEIAKAHTDSNEAIVAMYATGEYSFLQIAVFLTNISQLLERLYDQPKQIMGKQVDSNYCVPRI